MKIVKEKVMLVLGNGERIGLVKQVPRQSETGTSHFDRDERRVIL